MSDLCHRFRRVYANDWNANLMKPGIQKFKRFQAQNPIGGEK
jgi:hypothetical protein